MINSDVFEMNPYKQEDAIIDNSNIEDDLEYAKRNIRAMIDESLKLVPASIRIAKESESPRSIEVVSTLISSISSLNKELVNLTPKLKEDENVKSITNNNTLYLSSEEMFNKISQIPKGIINNEII
jgi:hypothetical protein